ncbi:PIN domain-containing protein [Candidatus Woesearchaeota archaeon]|nr:PIN domain-containing protein [Candidatus Woesearchaeota archaeon]
MILDTSFLIDLLRGKDNKVKDRIDRLDKEFIIKGVASISIMELWRGALQSANEKEKKDINELLKSLLIFNLDENAAKEAAEIEFELTKNGDIIDLEDIMIAGISKVRNEVLLTRNVKHFKRIKGVKFEEY